MSVYSKIPIKKPNRNAFNLSHSFRGCLNIGEIKPIARPIECVPGDTMITGNISKVELSPIVTEFFGELNFETWQFFVSNDSLFDPLNDTGKFTDILASLSDPTNLLALPYLSTNGTNQSRDVFLGGVSAYLYGLIQQTGNVSISSTRHLISYPLRAVAKIYNEWFKDENIQQDINASDFIDGLKAPLINYKKDRYTSLFTSSQKGPTIAFKSILGGNPTTKMFYNDNASTDTVNIRQNTFNEYEGFYVNLSNSQINTLNNDFAAFIGKYLNEMTSGITINDLRLYNQLQKWQERNLLCGTRIKEYLLSNYGVAPNDETLQRPVLIGHTVAPVVIDPIIANIKNQNTTSIQVLNQQGSRGGVGSASSSFKYGKWFCKEFGWIITLGCLRPKASYYQGVHKSLQKASVVQFFNPMFEHLGQQLVHAGEVYYQNNTNDDIGIGYQDVYNEMRHIEDFTAPDLAINFPTKTMFRQFANTPNIATLLPVRPTEYDYLFAVPSTQAPQAIFTSYNVIKAIRPISRHSIPKFIA